MEHTELPLPHPVFHYFNLGGAGYLQISEVKLLLNVVQLLLLRLNVSLQNARPLLQLLLQLVHNTELRLRQLIHGR